MEDGYMVVLRAFAVLPHSALAFSTPAVNMASIRKRRKNSYGIFDMRSSPTVAEAQTQRPSAKQG